MVTCLSNNGTAARIVENDKFEQSVLRLKTVFGFSTQQLVTMISGAAAHLQNEKNDDGAHGAVAAARP